MRLAAMVLAVALAGCATPGPNPYEVEYNAYTQYLNSQVAAGKLSLDEARYLQAQKFNQLRAASRAAAAADDAAFMNALGAAAAVNANNRPYTLPGNSINCTTFQRGPYGNINCQ